MHRDIIGRGQAERDAMTKFNSDWLENVVDTLGWSEWHERTAVKCIRWILYWKGLRETRP